MCSKFTTAPYGTNDNSPSSLKYPLTYNSKFIDAARGTNPISLSGCTIIQEGKTNKQKKRKQNGSDKEKTKNEKTKTRKTAWQALTTRKF